MVRIKSFDFIPRKKKPVAVSPPLLALVSAVYSINDATVTLTFNRAISVDEIEPREFVVDDGIYANSILEGTEYNPVDNNAVTIVLQQIESYTSSTCTLNVSDTNGIQDPLTGQSWSGVTDYPVTLG